jgi:uncharacterized protein YcfJ
MARRLRSLVRSVRVVSSATIVAAALGSAPAASVSAAIDLAALKILPRRGQSPDQARRDRYECHNWAVEQTGIVPVAPAVAHAAADQERQAASDKAKRVDRAERALGGAAIGAAIGGLITSDHHSGAQGPWLGAAVGAAIGAATAPDGDKVREAERNSGAGVATGENDYLRALSACMEGRGYKLMLPSTGEGDGDASK